MLWQPVYLFIIWLTVCHADAISYYTIVMFGYSPLMMLQDLLVESCSSSWLSDKLKSAYL